MSETITCPACRAPMDSHHLKARDGTPLTLDLCYACRGIWFDQHENTRLAPASVLTLFEQLHAHRGQAQQPLPDRLRCARCDQALVRGYDQAKAGRYVTFRCAERHGRFSTFGAFMVEKGFVRHLTDTQVETLAKRVGTIACNACGGTVDIRRDHACPWCRSALSLLDPEAVDKAMQQYGDEIKQMQIERNPEALADALVAIEQLNAREERTRQRDRAQGLEVDLLGLGIDAVWSLLHHY